MPTTNALYTILTEKIKYDALVLPTLPEIALKVQKAADDPDINLQAMSKVIAQDPALSIRMIKVANSAIMGRAVKVETLTQAVTRIGLRKIKNIATAMAVEQLFQSKNDIVAMYMKNSWQTTINIAAVAMTLMTFYTKKHKHQNFNLETITLGALVHNIGVLPILTEAERHPDVFANPTFLESSIRSLGGKIGAVIMQTWSFSDEFIEIVERWSDLTFMPDQVHYVDFIRVGAIYSDVLRDQKINDALLSSYVEKGVLPDHDFLKDEEFIEVFESVKAMFS